MLFSAPRGRITECGGRIHTQPSCRLTPRIHIAAHPFYLNRVRSNGKMKDHNERHISNVQKTECSIRLRALNVSYAVSESGQNHMQIDDVIGTNSEFLLSFHRASLSTT
jgi:hypothetical protein